MDYLPFPDRMFQVELALGVLEYAVDLDTAVHELSRVLVPDGIVILSMQNAFSPYRLWQRYGYRSILLKPLRAIARRVGPGPLLETASSFRHIRKLLNHNHLEVQDVVFYDFNLWLEPLDRLFPELSVATSRRLEWLGRGPLRGLGTGFIVKAKRHQESFQ
jgi:SAM-dependent methyltransferase